MPHTPPEPAGHHQCWPPADLGPVERQLAHLARILTRMEHHMSQIDDAFATLVTEVADLAAAQTDAANDVNRALTDLTNALAGNLTPEQQSALDGLNSAVTAVTNQAVAMKAAVDAADPATPPTA